MPHGKLIVVVESATGLKDSTLHGRGDSYCTLQCGSQVLSTHVAKGGSSHPIYHTEFEFEIDRSTHELAISVYSSEATREDELIGYTALDFKQVFYHGHTLPLTAYPLKRSSGKSGGSINISLKFKSRPSPYGNQDAHVPVRQHSAPQQHVRNPDFDDGYGSSGSDSSGRGSSRRRLSGGGFARDMRRTQSQSDQHYDHQDQHYDHQDQHYDHQDQYYDEDYHHNPQQYHHPRPSPLAPAAATPWRPNQAQPVPNRAQPVHNQAQPVPNRARPVYNPAPPVYNPAPPVYNPAPPVYNQAQPVYNQAQPVYNQQQPVYNQQQPVYNQQQPVYNRVQQPRPVQVQRPRPVQVQQPRPVQVQQQQQQGPSVAVQVGTVLAATAAKAAVQGLFGLL